MADSEATAKRKPIHKHHGPSFSLPKLKKIKRDLLTDLPLNSHECQSEILPLVQKSFHWRTSIQSYEFKRVQSVHNPELTAKYLEKRRDMKSCGYPDSFLLDTYAFLPVDNSSMVEKICRNGVKCGNQKFSGLGVSRMAVHLCRHADILAPSKQVPGNKIFLVVKVLKGKLKSVVCRNTGVQLEPTPNFDCHIAKPTTDPSVCLPPHLLFYSMQLYVYEYGDLGVEEYPKQILPYAVVHYIVKEPQSVPPHIPSLPPHMQSFVQKPVNGPKDSAVGPQNEIWRGRLYIKLIGGGHIYIDVSILSHFVPLTITLMSPVKVCHTYPNTNAQLTFLAGLTDIANKPEVPWRDYFFQSFVMKPSAISEVHFKALIRHVSSKQEMAAARLPKDVYLFLLPKCLLASQLGLVQVDNNDSVLYCILMSKVSTIKNHKNKLMNLVGKKAIRKCGKAKKWEELFEDSDTEETETSQGSVPKLNPVSLGAMFEQQRQVQNRLSAMSFADANAIFHPCGCGRHPAKAAVMNRHRHTDVQRVVTSIHAQLSSHHSAKPRFPPGSRTRPRQRVSHHSRAMPSFSPHRSSSDSDSDSDVGGRRRHSRRHRKHLSILDNKKTVEEELSEEELTNEQMEAIIFMRKPAVKAVAKPVPLQPPLPPPTTSHSSQSQIEAQKLDRVESKTISSDSTDSSSLRILPKIIPVEPLEDFDSGIASPTKEEVAVNNLPIIIPTEPVSPPRPTAPQSPKGKVDRPKVQPKSILKKSTSTPSMAAAVSSSRTVSPTSEAEKLPSVLPSVLPHQNDMGDIDMRIPQNRTTLSGPFSSTVSTPLTKDRDVLSLAPPPIWSRDNSDVQSSAPSPIWSQANSDAKSSAPLQNSSEENGDIQSPASSPNWSREKNDAQSWSQENSDAQSLAPPPIWSQAKSDAQSSAMTLNLSQENSNVQSSSSPPNWSQGSWLAPGSWHVPGEFPSSLLKDNGPCLTDLSLPHSPSLSQHDMPSSLHASPPSNSPPSPSPLSPGYDSPPLHSPPSPASSPPTGDIESPASPLLTESPASPPMSRVPVEFRTTPIAIPTVRLKHAESPSDHLVAKSFSKRSHSHKSPAKAEVENADDMMEFLNSAAASFDSDSPSEDDR